MLTNFQTKVLFSFSCTILMKTINVFVISPSKNRDSRRVRGANGCGNTVSSNGILELYFNLTFCPVRSNFIKCSDFGFLVKTLFMSTLFYLFNY
jgi:hypothetical protein